MVYLPYLLLTLLQDPKPSTSTYSEAIRALKRAWPSERGQQEVDSDSAGDCPDKVTSLHY